ncbi:MAG: GNAT family N-acetyltransferase [bacterium]
MIILSSKKQVISRSFRDDEDFWRVRRLLIETYPITPTAFNWEIRRWDGYRFYNSNPDLKPSWKEQVHLWETDDGKLIGVVHPEGSGDAHLELHPDFRHIEERMIEWAQDNLASPVQDGHERKLSMFVSEYDLLRCRSLEKLEYERTTSSEIHRRLRLGGKSIPQSTMPPGYVLRTTLPDDKDDCQRIADLLNAAFNRDCHTAEEFHVFSTHAPCFQHKLDLVAVAPNGAFAAYVGVPYIEENRYGVFEPVCTHPNHIRKGLARSLMLEGFHRLKKLGAADVYVVTGDQVAANKLYDAIGFAEVYKKYLWQKVLPM